MVECIKQTEESKMEGLLREGVHKSNQEDELTRWILEALSELTPEQTAEFLSQASQLGLLQPEPSVPG